MSADGSGAGELAAVHAELSMLVVALWYDIDHRDGAGAAGFFTVDAELTFSRATFRGTREIEDVYRGRAARGPRVSRHLTSNLHVLRRRPGLVDTVSNLVLHAQDGVPPLPSTVPVLIADVFDRFVYVGDPDGDPDGDPGRVAHRWLIGSRRIKNRFLLPGDVLAVPTE